MADPAAVPLLGVREAGAVIEADVLAHGTDGISTLRISAGTLELPGVHAETGARVRLRVLAQDVILSLTRPEGLSSVNVLPVEVEAIHPGDGPGAAIALRANQDRLLSRVTARAVTETGASSGLEVLCDPQGDHRRTGQHRALTYPLAAYLLTQTFDQLFLRDIGIYRQLAQTEMHMRPYPGNSWYTHSSSRHPPRHPTPEQPAPQAFGPTPTARRGATLAITACMARPLRATRADKKPRSAPSSSDKGPAALNTCTQSNCTFSDSGSKPCSTATPWMTRNSKVVVTGSSAMAVGNPPAPPAAPMAALTAWFSQLF